MSEQEQGRLLVYTGNGKGKTTAAIGLAIRAVGQGKKVGFIQFIKSPDRTVGERKVLAALGVDVEALGAGFTWTKTADEHRKALAQAWNLAKEWITSSRYDVIVLDELNNALAIDRFPTEDVLPLTEVLTTLSMRPRSLHLIVTGRGAKEELVKMADLVTEMSPVKHYYGNDVKAIAGLEY